MSCDFSLIDEDIPIIWKPCFRVETIEGEGVYLFSERKKFLLQGEVYLLLAPLIQRERYSAEDLAQLLKGKISPERVYDALIRLEKMSLIGVKDHLLPDSLAIFCSLQGIEMRIAAARLSSTKIYVSALREEVDIRFLELLRTLKLELASNQEEATFSILVVKDYLEPQLKIFNQKAIELGQSWMVVKPYGSQLWLGPIFEPKEKTPCWECLARRLKKNRVEECYIEYKKNLGQPFILHSTPPITPLAYDLAAIEIFKRIVSGKSEQLNGKILTFDTLEMKVQEHVLKQQKQCFCANEPIDRQEKSLILSPKVTSLSTSSGFHTLMPEETIKKFSHLISPITGIVGQLESQPLSSELFIYQGGVNLGLPTKLKGFGRKNFRSSVGGKGSSDADAKVGCLCEAIERYSGVFHGDEKRIESTYFQLKDDAIHPYEVIHFSQNQYKMKEQTNPASHSFNQVGNLFSDHLKLEWSSLWSLTEKRYKYFPTECCFYSYPTRENGWGWHADSNGCAAGNSIEEAILQAFLELVERDCIALWWYNRLSKFFVDLSSFDTPYLEKVIKTYENLDRELWVLDLTSDLKIPCFVALSRLKEGKEEKIIMGFGAHLDSTIALTRSLNEMNQMLPWSMVNRDNLIDLNIDAKIEQEWLGRANVDNQPHLKGIVRKSTPFYSSWKSHNLLEDIHYCQQIVEGLGMEVLVLDQTRDDIGLPVVRVVVPGLRHFWKRLGPGRLYDVPVKMGWVTEPRKESDLNPIGMFL